MRKERVGRGVRRRMNKKNTLGLLCTYEVGLLKKSRRGKRKRFFMHAPDSFSPFVVVVVVIGSLRIFD